MQTVRIVIVGVGGQGNVLASKLIGEAALASGVPVVMSETHGMAQRGGVVESTVVLGGALSPAISDGCGDVLLAFEPMEAVRALRRVRPDALAIASTSPLMPFIPGRKGVTYPEVDALLDSLRRKAGRVVAFDGRREAVAAGNALGLNMVMLGALYGAASLPLTPDAQRDAIRRGGKPAFAEANLACFERGLAAAALTN